MAALNHMKNMKAKKAREGLEDFIARCVGDKEAVNIEDVVDMFADMHIKIDEKDAKKMKKISNDEKFIKK